MVRLWWRNGAKIELLHSVLPSRRAPVWGLSGFSKQFHKARSRKPDGHEKSRGYLNPGYVESNFPVLVLAAAPCDGEGQDARSHEQRCGNSAGERH